MRYITLIALLISVVSASCNKPLPDYSAQPFVYTIAGDTDISVPSNDAGYFFSTLTLASGNAAMQPVTVSFKGIPPNVTLQEDSFSFRLNYSFGDLAFTPCRLFTILPQVLKPLISTSPLHLRSTG
jgi:hypothetical protein